MSVLEIVQWPDARLARLCAPVSDIEALKADIRDLFETMYAAPGRGLAGPQIGLMSRVFVMDAGWKDGTKTPLACINPEITERSDEKITGPEGCLSMPGVTADVVRHARITLAFSDLIGARQSMEMTGAEAIIAQHELDHLDGVMHFDRLETQARAALLKDYEALA
ncbi:peptide deformylase [Pacificoceanicola onchidii]|uniref:peptide deformylase n=1 Tax=Pacificoceanicola onchidii TaxID=2562685 RepID=UPI0010A35BD7|nr:peptide deformylase [Pacificoceanicola onchidii]